MSGRLRGVHGRQSRIRGSLQRLEDTIAEMRPGNFVFYDVMRVKIGSCTQDDVAVTVACPVVAKYRRRMEIVVYGGAIHLSKEVLVSVDGAKMVGLVACDDDER